MPRLRDQTFESYYDYDDDPLNRLLVPALTCSVRYDRTAGFFSSGALVVAAAGVSRLLHNGGHMRLLVGAQLSPNDVTALQGADRIPEDLLTERLMTALDEPEGERWRKRLEILAKL